MKRGRLALVVGLMVLTSAIPVQAEEARDLSDDGATNLDQMSLSPAGPPATMFLLAVLLLMAGAATVDVLAAEIERHRGPTSWSSEPLRLSGPTGAPPSRQALSGPCDAGR